MNLYLLTQTDNNDYETFDSAVVAAETEDEARMIHPRRLTEQPWSDWDIEVWTTPEKVIVQLIGVATEGTPKGVILASFNAG